MQHGAVLVSNIIIIFFSTRFMYQLRTSLSANFVFVDRFVNCRSASAGVQVWMQLQLHVSPHVFEGNPRQSWSLDSTLWILDSTLDSGFQSSVAFNIPLTVFRIP